MMVGMNANMLLTLAADVSAAPDRAGWIGTVLVIVVVAAVITISIKNAKRSHQD